MTKRIVLCADDYGQTHAISQGIIKLVQMGRITAANCLVNSPLWQEHAKGLFPFYKQIDIGLHLNLTEGKPLSSLFKEVYGERLLSLHQLCRYAYTRRLNEKTIEAECQAQIDCFADTLGFLPHFIDSYQHIHQLPIIRKALIRIYEKRLRRHHVYIRLINGKLNTGYLSEGVKKAFIYAAATHALKRLLDTHHIPHNLSFAGSYPFLTKRPYEVLFPRFLEEISDKGLIMCRPGLLTPSEEPDRVAQARFAEYQYLVGGRSLKDCHEKRVCLSKFK
jgi:chitin disaccharide deacetylase